MTDLTTGDTTSTSIACFLLTMPNEDWFKQAIYGAIHEASKESSWRAIGTVSIDDAIERAERMIESLMVFPFNPLPAGRIEAFAGTTIPDGWLLCDGSSVATADYPELFAAIAYTWGGSGGSFNLPDYRNRVILGAGDAYSIADSGGEASHTLIEAEMPSHSHIASGTGATDLGHTHVESAAIPTAITIGAGVPAPSALPSAGVTGAGFANISVTDPTISSTGGDGAHNNLQPYAAANIIIFAGR